MISFPVSWPHKALSPNSRVHWVVKARATAGDRFAAKVNARVAGAHKLKLDRPAVKLTFRPPDRRRRDQDNLIASCKAILDGIAEALGIDDSRFVLTFEVGEPARGGRIDVTISEAGA